MNFPTRGSPSPCTFTPHVKEDAINLFGFYTLQERELFQLMISVSGIGPKVAMNVLSGISATELLEAISGGNLTKLISYSGYRQENGGALNPGAQG